MDPKVAPTLQKAGFDVVSLANNHMGDWGREAFEDTMRRLQRAGIAYAGGGWNEKESLEPAVFDAIARRCTLPYTARPARIQSILSRLSRRLGRS